MDASVVLQVISCHSKKDPTICCVPTSFQQASKSVLKTAIVVEEVSLHPAVSTAQESSTNVIVQLRYPALLCNTLSRFRPSCALGRQRELQHGHDVSGFPHNVMENSQCHNNTLRVRNKSSK
jgi:hypothetical protein